jgi:hypothetical protein
MEWVAYDRLYPIDSEMRNEIRNGVMISSIINTILLANPYIKKTPKLYKPDDFIVDFSGSKKKEIPEQELQEKILSWAISTKRD